MVGLFNTSLPLTVNHLTVLLLVFVINEYSYVFNVKWFTAALLVTGWRLTVTPRPASAQRPVRAPELPGAMLRGRRALVTGASQGIGKAIAITLARRGASVAVNHRSDAELDDAMAVVELCQTFCRPSGGSAIAVRADVGRGAEVAEMFERLDEWAAATPSRVVSSGYVDGPSRKTADPGPAVHIVVNNAGQQTWKPLLDLEEEEWDDVLATNLKGTFLCTQHAARRMRDRGTGGAIINLGSGCNRAPFPMLSSYTSSKGGVDAFTKVSAVELGPLGIRVNCVAPGAIETERTKAETGDYASTWAPLTPLRRVGQPQDVADAITYLASDSSKFITGQTIYTDGGLFMQVPWPHEYDGATE